MKKCRIFVVIPTTRLTGRKSEIPRTVAALGIQVSFVDKKDAGNYTAPLLVELSLHL